MSRLTNRDFSAFTDSRLSTTDLLSAEVSSTLSTPYTDAINWGDQSVDSGVYNDSGAMVIEYYFAPGIGKFSRFFPRMDWTDYEKQQVAVAFDTYEAVINVEFVETNTAADAEFVLSKVNAFGLFLGMMNPPGEIGAGRAGFNAGAGAVGWDDTGGLEQGGFGFVTLIHEFGHGLGLAHPHDTGGGSTVLPGVSSSGDTGYLDLNQGVYTIMSYVDGWATHPSGQLTYADTVDWGYQGTPMAVDIALLQDKYGANEDYHNGDDVYYLPDTNEPGTFFACIWDTGGTDEIRFDGTGAVVIDLRDATLGIEEGGGGWISYADGIYGGYTIANGVMIENATGGSGNDALIGNEGDNVLTGNGGADTFIFTVDGGGYDTVTDFEDGVDLLDFSDYDRIRIWQFDVFSDDTGTTIIYEDQTVFLADIDPADLGRADFVL